MRDRGVSESRGFVPLESQKLAVVRSSAFRGV